MPVIRFTIAAMLLIALVPITLARFAPVDDVRLKTGETLHVTIIERTATTIRFVHPVLGEITLPSDAVAILPANAPAAATTTAASIESAATTSPSSSPSATASAAEPPSTQPVVETPPEAETPEKDWRFRLVLAAANAEGNTNSASVSTLFTATRETQHLRTVLDGSYFFSRSEGETSENRASAGFRHDWLNPGSKVFSFINGRFDYDEFQSWRYRAQGHVGLGYHLITPPKLRLDVLGGVGAVKQWMSIDDDLRPEALIGIDGEYALAAKHTIRFTSTFFPDLIDIDIYRWVNTAAWSWTIDAKNNLALTAGFQQEYQSQVDPGADHNDLRIYAGLQLDF